MNADPPVLYEERLSVPLVWWVLAALFALSLLLAAGLYLGPLWGAGTAAVTMAVAAAVFARSAVALRVDGSGLSVGRAWLGAPWVGRVLPLDAEGTERRAGVGADARAHLVLRPYVATAVEVEVADPGDPVPYWLVASRRPARLAAALRQVAAGEPR